MAVVVGVGVAFDVDVQDGIVDIELVRVVDFQNLLVLLNSGCPIRDIVM